MADTRILHKRGMHGDRIVLLDHLAFRCWVQYVLSADDYGVMRESASVLRADNPRLEREPMAKIKTAMGAVVASGLVAVFSHQSTPFWWQHDWQDFQMVKRPRATVMPAPSIDTLTRATEKTRDLFASWHPFFAAPISETFRKSSDERIRNESETKSTLAREHQQEQEPQQQQQPPDSRARDSVEPVWSQHRHGAIAGRGLVGDHRRCDPVTAAACDRGFCVPPWLAGQWRAQFGGNVLAADAEIRASVDSGLAALGPGPIGDAPKDYWPRWWQLRHGTKAAPVAARRPVPAGTTPVIPGKYDGLMEGE